MTWQQTLVIVACILAVMACGLHNGCQAVLPQMVTLVTFIVGGVIGIARGDKPGQ